MAATDVSQKKQLRALFLQMQKQGRRRKLMQQQIMFYLQLRTIKLCLMALLLLENQLVNGHGLGRMTVTNIRSCRRLVRNNGWWNLVWTTYSDKRFQNTFRVSKRTFLIILSQIRTELEKNGLTEDPVSPECRLGICLYRLGRGDYYYTISELTGLGVSTVCDIVIEVCNAIVKNLWNSAVHSKFPVSEEQFKECMEAMDQEWQFPVAFAAIDKCHLPIKCPSGGQNLQRNTTVSRISTRWF